MDPLEELYQLIDASIMEEPPISVREGGMIKDGYNENVDQVPSRKDRRKNMACRVRGKRA